MATNKTPVIFQVLETREITYERKSAFFGLIKWNVQLNSHHCANDIVLILKTPIRKIMIDNNGEIQEIDLKVVNK